MKTFYKGILLLSVLLFSVACSKDNEDDEITRELLLSVPTTGGSIETDDLDFTFEILDGNGGYTATVSEVDGDPDAHVTIEGNTVTVNILVGGYRSVEVTITDQKGEEATVHLRSYNKSIYMIKNYFRFSSI